VGLNGIKSGRKGGGKVFQHRKRGVQGTEEGFWGRLGGVRKGILGQSRLKEKEPEDKRKVPMCTVCRNG